MPLKPEQIEMLDTPLDSRHVKQGKDGFSHIEGHHAIREANRIFGFDGWSRETLSNEVVREEEAKTEEGILKIVTYKAKVRITLDCGGRMIYREGTGSGKGTSYLNWSDCHNDAMKQAETDAAKRAKVTFGDQFGLALYDHDQPRVVDGQAAEDAQAIRELASAIHNGEAEAYIAARLADINRLRAKMPGDNPPIESIEQVPAADRRRWIDALRSKAPQPLQEPSQPQTTPPPIDPDKPDYEAFLPGVKSGRMNTAPTNPPAMTLD